MVMGLSDGCGGLRRSDSRLTEEQVKDEKTA